MRTRAEINAEVETLRALKPIGSFREKTRSTLEASLEELLYGVDDTAEEWEERPLEEQDAVLEARRWKEGDSDVRPSSGWEGLVE